MANLDIEDIIVLKSIKHTVQDTLFCPAIGACVDVVSATEFFGRLAICNDALRHKAPR